MLRIDRLLLRVQIVGLFNRLRLIGIVRFEFLPRQFELAI